MEEKRIGDWTGQRIRFGNSDLLVIKAKNGYVACSYIDIATAERLGDAACIVSNVKDYEDILKAKVIKATTKAKSLGACEGMSGKAVLHLFS